MNKHPYTIAVEGNIGSGKSLFINYFKKHESITALQEPVELWKNCNGHNLLENVYLNPKEFGFTFQSYVLLTLLQQHKQEITSPVKLMERSVYSARYCFIEKMIKEGHILEPSAAVLDKYFRWIIESNYAPVDLIIYLRTTPEVAYERVRHRNRNEEKSLSFKSITEIHDIHENWLIKQKICYNSMVPIIVINACLDKTEILTEYKKFEEQIKHLFW